MSILDSQRYVETMTRKEIADALKNGHPLVPGFLLADRAKQLQQNEALLKVLEQQAGLPAPGTSIIDKLEAYLRNPNPAERQPGQAQPPGGPQGGPPGGPPGGPRPPGPGPMPQGGPPGAGGPMPGPQAPGGAGGPMPGMPRGPQGPGAPMASGGMIPGYQEGSLVDDYIDERDSFGIGDALMYPINHPIKSASALALAKMFGPKRARDLMSMQGLRGMQGAGGSLMGGVGSLLRSGAQKRGPVGWASKALTRPWWGADKTKSMALQPHGEFGGQTAMNAANRVLGRRGLGKGILGGLAAWALNPFGGGDDGEPDVTGDATGSETRPPGDGGAGGGAGGAGGPGSFGDLMDEMRSTMSTPTAQEQAYYDLLNERSGELRGQRERMLGAERKAAQADALMGVSEFLGRRGRPDQITMGGVGALMGKGSRERRDLMDDLGTRAFDVSRAGGEAQAARSVAGREMFGKEIDYMMSEREAQHAMQRVLAQVNAQTNSPEMKISMLQKLYESVRESGEDNPALERALMKQMMDLAGLDPLTARLAQGATE
tara:strand:- start:133 stop:1767 length:1635 start_codon:yes stop_codon:yes gene_type:complete